MKYLKQKNGRSGKSKAGALPQVWKSPPWAPRLLSLPVWWLRCCSQRYNIRRRCIFKDIHILFSILKIVTGHKRKSLCEYVCDFLISAFFFLLFNVALERKNYGLILELFVTCICYPVFSCILDNIQISYGYVQNSNCRFYVPNKLDIVCVCSIISGGVKTERFMVMMLKP